MGLDLDAGKYAFYVWAAYGASAGVIAAMVAETLIRAARWRREAERLQAQKDAKAKAK